MFLKAKMYFVFFYSLLWFHFNPVLSYGLIGLGNGLRWSIREKLYERNGKFFDENHKTLWIEQPLDHFDSGENRTWKMRYFERLDLWKEGGPLFIFIGGEGTAQAPALYKSIMSKLANETNGAMYLTEHRYYGESTPFPELTTQNLKYLSSRQALADIAYLLKHIKANDPRFKDSKIVVIGGSYSGNLSAWMRLLYPDLVFAAIASSAPVLAKADFYEYLEKVSDDYKKYETDGCIDNIQRIFKRFEKLFETDAGIAELKKEENICEQNDITKPENKQLFFTDKLDKFMFNSQYGKPNDIKRHCETLINSTHVSSCIDREPNFWNEERNCYTYDFDDLIEYYKKHINYMSWSYQTCTEFGYYQTTNSKDQPFTNNVPIEFFYKICTGLFGPEFDETRIERGVKETNDFYGGLHPNVTHVIFPNGDMDPWSRLGIVEDLSMNAPTKIIPGASHCNDLYADSPEDDEELKEARRYIKNMIKKWLGVSK